jgi:hypothetical protein
VARGRCVDEDRGQELCGSMLSGSGRVAEHSSETIGEKHLGPTKVRVLSRLMQVPVKNHASTMSLSWSACSRSSSLSLEVVQGAPRDIACKADSQYLLVS